MFDRFRRRFFHGNNLRRMLDMNSLFRIVMTTQFFTDGLCFSNENDFHVGKFVIGEGLQGAGNCRSRSVISTHGVYDNPHTVPTSQLNFSILWEYKPDGPCSSHNWDKRGGAIWVGDIVGIQQHWVL